MYTTIRWPGLVAIKLVYIISCLPLSKTIVLACGCRSLCWHVAFCFLYSGHGALWANISTFGLLWLKDTVPEVVWFNKLCKQELFSQTIYACSVKAFLCNDFSITTVAKLPLLLAELTATALREILRSCTSSYMWEPHRLINKNTFSNSFSHICSFKKQWRLFSVSWIFCEFLLCIFEHTDPTLFWIPHANTAGKPITYHICFTFYMVSEVHHFQITPTFLPLFQPKYRHFLKTMCSLNSKQSGRYWLVFSMSGWGCEKCLYFHPSIQYELENWQKGWMMDPLVSG